MGWHYILTFTCKVLPEFLPFLEKKYFETLYDKANDTEYFVRPRRHYDSDDERSINEKKWIEEWQKEREEEEAFREREYEGLPKNYKDIVDIWRELNIGSTHFYEYDLKGDIFKCQIQKKVAYHEGDLREDYESFLKDILVPMTSEILDCEIESDDFGDAHWRYTDLQLRNIPFRLRDKIKNIEHVYSEDGTEIVQSIVIYKHSIPKKQLVDLNRSYSSW